MLSLTNRDRHRQRNVPIVGKLASLAEAGKNNMWEKLTVFSFFRFNWLEYGVRIFTAFQVKLKKKKNFRHSRENTVAFWEHVSKVRFTLYSFVQLLVFENFYKLYIFSNFEKNPNVNLVKTPSKSRFSS